MSSSLRRSIGVVQHESLGNMQIEKMGPICKARNDLLSSISAKQDTSSDEHVFGKECMFFMSSPSCSSPSSFLRDHRLSNALRLLVLELLASRLSLTCHVLRKKITLSDFSPISYDDSTSCHEPSCLTIKSQSFRRILDFDISNYSVSLLNLDAEDCELISDTDQLEYEHHFQSDFPSPSYSSVSTTFSAQDEKTECEIWSKLDLESAASFEDLEFTDEEPLFWPFDNKWDCNSTKEAWRFFTMSPRKNNETFRRTGDDPFELRHGQRGKRLELNLRPAEELARRKSKVDGRVSPSASRLSRETNNYYEKVEPLENKNDKLCRFEKSDKLEKDLFASKKEAPIEMFLGLDAFDGHEGVESEFNQYDFSLDDSLF